MELKYKLLDHPFYQAWSCGEITMDQLSGYGESYKGFIEQMPALWSRVSEGLKLNGQASEIIKEEAEHIPLWDKWRSTMQSPASYPDMNDVIDEFNKMNPSELAGAIHSFEIQQPEVARTKKEGLMKFYNFKEESLTYFDHHMAEDEHIDFGRNIYEKHAHQEDFEKGFERGAELVYNSLNKFM